MEGVAFAHKNADAKSDSVYRPCTEMCVSPAGQPPVTRFSFTLLIFFIILEQRRNSVQTVFLF